MENVMLIGLSRQIALRNQMSVVANNLANIETAGFKAEHLVFEEIITPVDDTVSVDGAASDVSFVQDAKQFRDFAEGAFTPTGNPLDVAINGKGWFVTEANGAERYTRNGHFKLNADGELVNAAGAAIQGESGPITFGPGETNIVISGDGTISSSAGEKGKLRVVIFENETQLKKVGDNLFESPTPATPAENVQLAQGVIEKSNVKPVLEMSRLIEVSRSYMSTSRMLQTLGDLERRTIERLGDVTNI